VLTASALRTGLAPVAPPARTSDPGDEGPDAAKVAATAEDLDVFERVKKIVAPSPSKVAVVYKATTSYFALNLGKVTRWFMRFYGSGAVKHVVLRIPLERAANQLGGMNGTAVNVNETRVNVTSSTDVDKIAAAVLAAYETEVHRKDAGTDVEH
jgi:acylphosphatase